MEDVEVTPEHVSIFVSTRTRALVKCSLCGNTCSLHDRIEHTWRHTDVCDPECFVTAKIPRCKCPKCGVEQTQVPWARENVNFTDSFEGRAMLLMQRMPLTKAAEFLHVGTWVLEGILRYHVQKALDNMDLSNVRNILLDETSCKRGHRYITVIADADTKRIIFMTEGRGSDSLRQFSDWLIAHNGDPSKIKLISCDFSKSFLSGIKNNLPKADIVYDKFHLVKMVNEALDKVRSKDQMNGSRHKWIRFKLMKNGKGLSDDDKQKIFDIENDDIILGLVYEMKGSLIQLYDYPDVSTTSEHLKQWIYWVDSDNEIPIKAVGRTVSRHFHKILNRYAHKMSNGFLKGLNKMIQTTKHIGCDYPNTQNFITMIFFRHERLDI